MMRKTPVTTKPVARNATLRDPKGKFLKQAAVQPMTPIETASPTANVKQVNANQAYEAMLKGLTVQRVDTNGAFGKFHRLHNGEVQTADTADKMMAGDWHRARTDVASWYASTFAVVTVKVVQVQLVYT
jgi:hypothetical protein